MMAGVEAPTLWPLASEMWQLYTKQKGAANMFHFRLGPFYADAETEVEWEQWGGPYMTPGGEWNPAFWQRVRELAWNAYLENAYVEVVAIDTWGCKYSQAGNRYVSWPQDAIDACGKTWHPEHERYARKVVEELGCFGNVIWALDNEGMNIHGWQGGWYWQLGQVLRDEEKKSGCGFTHVEGTSVDGVRTQVDYSITHARQPLTVIDNRWSLQNEHNPSFSPAEEAQFFADARKQGLGWALWRDGMDDAAFEDTLARFRAVVEGNEPPPPPLPTCTLGTPTARELVAQGKRVEIKVQRTVAGAGVEPAAGKWITATPTGCFGRDYYCSIGWQEACDEGMECGPVAPEGDPQRPPCEAQFLEVPCPHFVMDRCTGTGEQCPITFDTYIVIDGVNQLHPANVRAGCRESTYVKDPDGRLLSGEWWKATAHGKGYIRACNFDSSVCGISTFEIDQ
jgi:hypothetical protein